MKTYSRKHEVMKLYFFILILTMSLAFMGACEPKKGATGPAGDGCVVVQLENGAQILCGKNTQAVILNGSVEYVTAVIDPCGKETKRDEVVLRLSSGELVQTLTSSGRSFLAIVGPGDYETKDKTNCKYSVDADLTLVDETGNYFTK